MCPSQTRIVAIPHFAPERVLQKTMPLSPLSSHSKINRLASVLVRAVGLDTELSALPSLRHCE